MILTGFTVREKLKGRQKRQKSTFVLTLLPLFSTNSTNKEQI